MYDPIRESTRDSASLLGMTGGMVLSALGTFEYDQLIVSVLLGAVGTASSFTMTLVCKWIYGKLKKRKGK